VFLLVYDIFVSYQEANKPFAEKLAKRIQSESIEGKKVTAFFAETDIGEGKNLVLELETALKDAKFCAMVLSPTYLNAEWPTAERSYAIYSDPSGRLGRIIPILREPCEIPPFLAYRKYVNMIKDSDFEKGVEKILQVLGKKESKTINGVTSVQTPATLSFQADEITETIYSNIYEVQNIPQTVWSAPTTFTEVKEIYQSIDDQQLPPFVLKEKRLFTFCDLSNTEHSFHGIIEDFDIQSHRIADLLKDSNRRYWLVDLFNKSLRNRCYEKSMAFDPKSKKFFFRLGALKNVKIPWQPHIKHISKELIIEYKNTQTGVINFYAHRAVNFRFLMLGEQVFLKVENGFVFTRDGQIVFSRKGLATKFLSRQKNLQNFNENRFWPLFFSTDGKKIEVNLGEGSLEISTIPLSVKINAGIIGDQKDITFKEISAKDLELKLEEKTEAESDELEIGEEDE